MYGLPAGGVATAVTVPPNRALQSAGAAGLGIIKGLPKKRGFWKPYAAAAWSFVSWPYRKLAAIFSESDSRGDAS